MTNPTCLNCGKIKNCPIVDEQKVFEGFRCDGWKEVDNPAKVVARDQILRRFGLAGAAALIGRTTKEEE